MFAWKKQKPLKRMRGGIFQEGGPGDPNVPHFSHISTFLTVREIEMTFPSIFVFLSVLM